MQIKLWHLTEVPRYHLVNISHFSLFWYFGKGHTENGAWCHTSYLSKVILTRLKIIPDKKNGLIQLKFQEISVRIWTCTKVDTFSQKWPHPYLVRGLAYDRNLKFLFISHKHSAKIQILKEIRGGQLSTYANFVQVLEKLTLNQSS